MKSRAQRAAEKAQYELHPKQCPVCGADMSFARFKAGTKTCGNICGRQLNRDHKHKTRPQRLFSFARWNGKLIMLRK